MRISKVAFAITALLAASQVNAGGFQVNESSASGLGRANSGEAAIGDDAASLARNPALMALFDTAQLSVVGTYVMPSIDMKGEGNLNNDDIAPAAAIPALYYIQPLNDKFAVGLAIYSGYGMGTEYKDDYVYGSAAGETEIVTINFNPNVSYRFSERLSFGAGVDVVYATAKLKRNAGAILPPKTSIADMEGDTVGYGWNAGALYELNQNNRFGISYKSKIKLELEGDYQGTSSRTVALNPLSSQNKVAGELDINLPSVLEISAYHKLTNKIAISYDWQYTTWSDFGDIVATSVNKADCTDGSQGQCLLKEEDYDNSSRFAVGTEYDLSEAVTLRAGYAYDEQAGKSTLSIPDTDRQWFTAGMTYRTSPTLSFDFAAAYILGKDSKFDEDVPIYGLAGAPTNRTFETESAAYIVSAQMNYSF